MGQAGLTVRVPGEEWVIFATTTSMGFKSENRKYRTDNRTALTKYVMQILNSLKRLSEYTIVRRKKSVEIINYFLLVAYRAPIIYIANSFDFVTFQLLTRSER